MDPQVEHTAFSWNLSHLRCSMIGSHLFLVSLPYFMSSILNHHLTFIPGSQLDSTYGLTCVKKHYQMTIY